MFRMRRDEQGATAVIVVLSLVAILGLIVLTVDVGQLLFKRRAMVNASDAAALAAAQSCAGVNDTDNPETMADTFAIDNATGLIAANGGIIDVAGCDGDKFGHVTVEYQIPQKLFFAGVLGFDGPATVKTEATAGWGPARAANPLPIVVYTGQSQGNCDINEQTLKKDQKCYLWYDNDRFAQSAFGFLNLCTVNDSCTLGWDVGAGDHCPNVGASLRRDWIAGNWTGGPNRVDYPDTTFVCRVSGLASSDWSELKNRIGDDLLFPVNDCSKMVDKNGTAIGCDATTAPDKYDIVGFIVLHLDGVLDSKSQWAGSGGSCSTAPMNMVPSSPNIDLDTIAPGLGCTPYDSIANVQMKRNGNPKCCTVNVDFTYDPVTHVVDWIGANRTNVTLSWDYAKGGPCGTPPGNSSAVCLQVTTVEVRFNGVGACDAGDDCPDFGVRGIRLCDLTIGSCPEQN
jgi:hypothetical protein